MGSLVDDELEEGEIREIEERSIGHFPETISYFDDFEEGEIRAEKVEEGEISAEKVEEGEISAEKVEEGEISAEKIEKGEINAEKVEEGEISEEKVEEEIMATVQNAPAYYDNLEEGEIRDETYTSFTRQVEEICSKRFNELLCLQYLECKKFKLLKNVHKMVLKVNCSGKLSTRGFEILNGKFEKHMKAQHRILIAMLIEARNRELKLKKKWLEKAREGTLEGPFCETPLTSSGFQMENFDYEVEMGDISKNGNILSDDVHLDVADDEGSLGSEPLLEGQVEADHEITEVSQCNDHALNATCVDPKDILTSPSISKPSCDFERSEEMNDLRCNDLLSHLPPLARQAEISEEMKDLRCNDLLSHLPPLARQAEISEEMNDLRCNETLLVDSESCAENLNPNCSVIMSGSDFQSGEETLEEHDLACVGTVSIGSAETIQNHILNTNGPLEIVCSDQIVATDSSSHASIRPQEFQVNPATNLPYNSGITAATNLRGSTEENITVETPLVSQNEAFVEQSVTQAPTPATDVGTQNLNVIAETPAINQNEAFAEQPASQMLATDTVTVTQLLQTMRHDVDIDPLQNELSALRKLQKALAERHNEKMARLRTDCERELDNTRRKFQRLEAEADAQWSNRRAHIDTAYQKLCMHRKLAEEFQHMFYRPNLVAQLPIQVNWTGVVGRAQCPLSTQPQFTPNSILRPAMPFATRPSTVYHGLLPNPYTAPQVTQPCASLAFIPSGQRPMVLMQGPQNFLNQPTVMHSSLAGASIGRPVQMGVCPGISQLNHMRPSSLLMPSVRAAMANFGNIQI